MRKLFFILIGLLLVAGTAHALRVVGDSGTSSIYTNGASAGNAWNYVGYLQGTAPSSVTYISNQWFVTAHHVWDNDIIGKNEKMLVLGGTTYSIDTGSYISITNASGSEADLCMFRVTDSTGLPAGIHSLTSKVNYRSSLLMIGNGYDNYGKTGLTWGNGSIYASGTPRQTYTATDALNNRDTTYFLSVYYTNTTGSAYAQTFDSGGGTFVNSELAGIMVAIGTGIGNGVTYITDAGTYGAQINNTALITDVDEDGIPDNWEYAQSGSMTGVVASLDQDGDGFVGADEYTADTNPTNPASFLEVSGFSALTNQTVWFNGSTGREYQVFYTTNDLADTNISWTAANSPVAGTGTNSSITVTNTEEKAFYRLKAALP